VTVIRRFLLAKVSSHIAQEQAPNTRVSQICTQSAGLQGVDAGLHKASLAVVILQRIGWAQSR
jgi:hypothetical protein